MSDLNPTSSDSGNSPGPSKRQAQGLRYSLQEMIDEVHSEREHSVMGRELLDATEIGKMFADKRHRKRRKP
ncbi:MULTISPECIES: hypothetical protein [unclassified Lentimonas]|uniref:hypothetical protein n=1 Tax=unclassified Lentimonas TaxID=2630993 RepID=UPI001326463E|nr:MULTISPECIES: hypothetical protein [unclassified Lentimonas]CAA6678469.1 Unannotated [Lentimonas sp. CC4]CAA6685562.1 Unannotated [Lentimonas sp. CC6]CAA6689693.1 Unannotated [Lentimonas sp. CC19]CAA6690455.1 Unannotated [Lentimonas sp. CC10]CAA7068714.1 Unannotated [Lentimonas sp. CC11]